MISAGDKGARILPSGDPAQHGILLGELGESARQGIVYVGMGVDYERASLAQILMDPTVPPDAFLNRFDLLGSVVDGVSAQSGALRYFNDPVKAVAVGSSDVATLLKASVFSVWLGALTLLRLAEIRPAEFDVGLVILARDLFTRGDLPVGRRLFEEMVAILAGSRAELFADPKLSGVLQGVRSSRPELFQGAEPAAPVVGSAVPVAESGGEPTVTDSADTVVFESGECEVEEAPGLEGPEIIAGAGGQAAGTVKVG